MNQKRSERITLRLTRAEVAKMKLFAKEYANGSISDYIRTQCFEAPVIKKRRRR